MSPFHAMWNLIHLLISPAASHSGWEDVCRLLALHIYTCVYHIHTHIYRTVLHVRNTYYYILKAFSYFGEHIYAIVNQNWLPILNQNGLPIRIVHTCINHWQHGRMFTVHMCVSCAYAEPPVRPIVSSRVAGVIGDSLRVRVSVLVRCTFAVLFTTFLCIAIICITRSLNVTMARRGSRWTEFSERTGWVWTRRWAHAGYIIYKRTHTESK